MKPKRIPAFRLVPKPLEKAAEGLPRFERQDEVGTRHQLGGDPVFIQKRQPWPTCSECKEPLAFLAQIDSVNDEFCIADCGMVYIFFCFDCNHVKALVHSY